MKKKHRDIVVDGVQYGWMVKGYGRVRIFKTKNEFVDFEIDDDRTITPNIVAALIKDPDALKWINAEPCPFCGECVSEATPALSENYFMVIHTEDCYYYKLNEKFSLIPKDNIEIWNKRS